LSHTALTVGFSVATLTLLLTFDGMILLTAMVEYLPPLPAGRTPSKEWSITYAKSLSGILKFVEVVRGHCYRTQ